MLSANNLNSRIKKRPKSRPIVVWCFTRELPSRSVTVYRPGKTSSAGCATRALRRRSRSFL
ncbi:hypothetical protein BX600DRAFT_447324, partial [Xylariales sp. PMI_506]